MIKYKVTSLEKKAIKQSTQRSPSQLFFKAQNQHLIHILKKMVDFDGGCCKWEEYEVNHSNANMKEILIVKRFFLCSQTTLTHLLIVCVNLTNMGIIKNEIHFEVRVIFNLNQPLSLVNLEENWYDTNPSNVAIKILLKFSFIWFQISQQHNDLKVFCCNQN